jgi:hypothetical protein
MAYALGRSGGAALPVISQNMDLWLRYGLYTEQVISSMLSDLLAEFQETTQQCLNHCYRLYTAYRNRPILFIDRHCFFAHAKHAARTDGHPQSL